MRVAAVILFVMLNACMGNAVVEPHSQTRELTAINACVSALRENNSALIEASSGNLMKEYHQVRIDRCSHCYYISVTFGRFLENGPVDPNYISDRRAPACSVDKETLEVVNLIAPNEPNSMELVEYVTPDLPLAERRYNKLVELSEKKPRTTVHSIEQIYSYSQGEWEKITEKMTEKLLKDIL